MSKDCIIPPIGSEEVIEITLTPEKYPIAYKNKLDELLEQGAFNNKEDAERWIRTTPIQLELVYEKHCGLFALESNAIESDVCYSPYTTRDLVEEDLSNKVLE